MNDHLAHIVRHAFADELIKIASTGTALRRAAIGAGVGGLAAGVTGQENHIGKAMLAGALAPTVAANPRRALGVAGVGLGMGVPLYAGSRAVRTQFDHDQRVGNKYTRSLLSQPASSPNEWL